MDLYRITLAVLAVGVGSSVRAQIPLACLDDHGLLRDDPDCNTYKTPTPITTHEPYHVKIAHIRAHQKPAPKPIARGMHIPIVNVIPTTLPAPPPPSPQPPPPPPAPHTHAPEKHHHKPPCGCCPRPAPTLYCIDECGRLVPQAFPPCGSGGHQGGGHSHHRHEHSHAHHHQGYGHGSNHSGRAEGHRRHHYRMRHHPPPHHEHDLQAPGDSNETLKQPLSEPQQQLMMSGEVAAGPEAAPAPAAASGEGQIAGRVARNNDKGQAVGVSGAGVPSEIANRLPSFIQQGGHQRGVVLAVRRGPKSNIGGGNEPQQQQDRTQQQGLSPSAAGVMEDPSAPENLRRHFDQGGLLGGLSRQGWYVTMGPKTLPPAPYKTQPPSRNLMASAPPSAALETTVPSGITSGWERQPLMEV